ncbi:MAG: hypothetical protein CMJ65_10825 [Planctomycetaceae bacterium]|nr:hypothetical protein [Planctomycetaceae bacterium]
MRCSPIPRLIILAASIAIGVNLAHAEPPSSTQTVDQKTADQKTVEQKAVDAATAAKAAADAAEAKRLAEIEKDRRATAVALNYCRASFHRIRKNPSKTVMLEEQSKILNNLNLSGIADQEIIKLYSAVLDEIHQVEIAEKERVALESRHKREFQRRLFTNAMMLGTELATAQFVGAVRTGANSWWDYRASEDQRDGAIWKVEKGRLTTVVSKSSIFLDTFWRMAKKKNIPDEWLIRGSDLDRLQLAMQIRDPKRRLRVLRRMQRFMIYYPPYWYYIARTQQQMGQLFAALKTYERLGEVARGHFRNDDMLAAGLANQSLIQAHLSQPGAHVTALKALDFSSSCWQANLLCASVLADSGQTVQAEDAILANLDTDLERSRSLVHLLSLYYRSGDTEKLTQRLSDPRVCKDVPVPVLLRCASRLDAAKVPAALNRQLAGSLVVMPHRQFGPDDIVVVAGSGWQLGQARLTLNLNGRTVKIRPRLSRHKGQLVARFSRVGEFGNPLSGNRTPPKATLILDYPDTPKVRLALGDKRPNVVAAKPAADDGLRITAIQFDKMHLSLIAVAGR